MDKIITINLGGHSIKIEEDAYESLKPYIRQIEQTFAHTENGKEIINDIEARIAEMLEELTKVTLVASMKDVEFVKSAMGNPGEFDQNNPEEDNATKSTPQDPIRKRLYRDTDSKFLGGVCSGISNYFAIDPVIVRLIWILFFFFGGASLLIYLIMWVIVPEAVTTAQKLEMRGEAPTLDNIINRVKNEAGKVEQNLKSQHFGKRLTDFLNALSPLILVVFKVFASFVGLILLAVLSVLLIGLVIGNNHIMLDDNGFILDYIPNVFDTRWEFSTVKALLALFMGIPLFIILASLIKFIFNSKVNYRPVRRILGYLWIATIPLLFYFLYTGVRNFRSNESIVKEKTITMKSDVLIKADFKSRNSIFERLSIQILPSDDSLFHIITEQSASGSNPEKAREMAEKNGADFTVSGNELILKRSDYFAKTALFRKQRTDFILKVPHGKGFTLDPSIHQIGASVEGQNLNYYASERKVKSQKFVFLNQSLYCPSCPDSIPTGSSSVLDLNNFTRIEASGAVDIEIIKGNKFNIQKIGSSDVVSQLDIYQSNDVLIIGMKKGYLHLHSKPKLIITMPMLESINLSGASECKAGSFGGDRLNIECNGASRASLSADFDRINIDLSGASHLDISGNTKEIEFDLTGASNVDAHNLSMDVVRVNLSGASKGIFGLSKTITGEITGASEIEYYGNPEVDVDNKGLSKIKRVNSQGMSN